MLKEKTLLLVCVFFLTLQKVNSLICWDYDFDQSIVCPPDKNVCVFVVWDQNSELNPDPDLFYDAFCADNTNPADFIRFETQMPLCNTRNETAGLATSCCTESNCNQVITPAVVSRCYVGGLFKDANTDTNITIPIVSKQCLPPNNKYCQYVNGVWSVGNDYEKSYFCFSQCYDKTNKDFTGDAYCCQTDNCNVPKNLISTTATSSFSSVSLIKCLNSLIWFAIVVVSFSTNFLF